MGAAEMGSAVGFSSPSYGTKGPGLGRTGDLSISQMEGCATVELNTFTEGRAMNAAGGADSPSRLGFTAGQVVQEFYYDSDVDETVRSEIAEATGQELVDEDYSDVADGALLWWRAEDADEEDLTDLIVDAISNLDNGGVVWVMTPKPGRDGHVPPSEVEQAASTSGLSATSTIAAGPDWSGIRLVARSRR